ncbi:uncharacterized protein K489DRAFT_316388, partial [Dissoconium aciculare CBS 342.82]|uniref:HET-domain-containing protein n=1 Tax=Dissoconium aciculare CBS 342.82 TaxID=1314786 RepID=A0A6J3M9E1_9PEZI
MNKKESFAKITFIAEQAKKEGIKHFWVDNCCIDKRNHSELSASILSMYRWYEESTVCYVYLTDFPTSKRNLNGTPGWEGNFLNCRWFKRGWTLQELLAPARVEFFAYNLYLGDRSSLSQEIHKITGIRVDALMGTSPKDIPIATRLRWATGRETTVPEDEAYAIMGLCGVEIMPRYGESRAKAKQRLNEEIRKTFGNAGLDLASTWSEQKSAEILRQDQSEARRKKLKILQFDRMDSRKIDIAKAHRKTCNWILENPKVLKWRDMEATKQHFGFLWIKGHPGAGKSVLMKHLEADTLETKGPRDICISFYFYARGEELEKSLEGMYRSLLTQLLRSDEDLQIVLDQFGSNSGSRTMLGRLRTLLSATIRKLEDRRLLCFIDALDECNSEDMQDTIDYFRGLCEEATEIGVQVYICFASRYYPTLNIPTGLQLELDSIDEHHQDLSEYVKSQRFFLGPQGKPTSIPTQIQNNILAKANGVFLWIVLVVEILKMEYLKGRLHAVEARLHELPPDLETLFKDIVQRDRENIDEFMFCLTWILYAKRPLSLEEFYFAMMAESGQHSLEWDDTVLDDFMHNFLRNSSKGLAELSKGKDRRVQFIHESVRDFLLKADGLKYVDPDHNTSACQAHERLKQCCMRGIQTQVGSCLRVMKLADHPARENTKWHPALQREECMRLRENFPFLDYATHNIFYHSDQAATEVPQWSFIARFDIKNWLTKANWLQQHDLNVYTEDTNLSYVLAQLNCANLISLLA